MKTLEDFPFDPDCRIHELSGLEKLRAIADPQLRKLTFEFYIAMEANEQKPEFHERIRQAEREKLAGEYELLHRMADRAHEGAFGASAKEIARRLVPPEQPRTRAVLLELQKKIRELPREARR